LRAWLARPAKYRQTVHEAPPLQRDYAEPAKPESRMKDQPVADVAKRLDVWLQGWWHRRWERLPLRFTIWVTIAVVTASLFEIVPTFLVRSNVPTISSVGPYTPLELAGRDIYLSEGCYNCHSQMVRPILAETKRYGEYSKAGEFVYDHPFQWGSRRIGPDLAREGGKQSPLWHVLHFQDPKQVVQGSIMPPYPWLLQSQLDFEAIPVRMKAMRMLGVEEYTDEDIQAAVDAARGQASEIAERVERDKGPANLEDKQVIALVAYLDRLGVDLFKPPPAEAAGGEAAALAAGGANEAAGGAE
jgi:cytochrome c oxidase cbb3-type subunit I/II